LKNVRPAKPETLTDDQLFFVDTVCALRLEPPALRC
jgi:hypothetical protein